MASAIANLVVNFDAATGPFNRKVGLMRRTLRGLGGLARNIALAVAPLSVGAMFAGAIRSGEEFNRAMTRSLSIMDDVGDALRDKMAKEAINVAKVTQFSAAEVARGYFFLASAGLTAEDAIGSLAIVARFAQAGNFDLATATSLAADAQAAMGLRVGTTEQKLANLVRVTDVLTKANTLANATTEEFSRALTNKAAAAARIVGMEIEQVVAVLAVFANQGVKSVDAGTAFNIVMRDLTTKAIRFREAFEAAGVAVFEKGEFRNLADIIRDLTDAMSSMTAEQKKALLLNLHFADKSISFIQVLLGTSQAMRDFEKALDEAGGTVERVSGQQLTVIQKAMEKLKGTLTETGKAFIDLNENAIAKFLRGITTAIPAVFEMAGQIASWIAFLLLAKLAIWAVTTAVWTYIAALEALAIAKVFVKAVGVGPAGWIQLGLAIAAASAAVVVLKGAFDATIGSLRKAGKEADNLDEKLKKLMGDRKAAKTPSIFSGLVDADLSPAVAQAVKMQDALLAVLLVTEKLRAQTGKVAFGADSAARLEEAAEFFESLKDAPGIVGETARRLGVLTERMIRFGTIANRRIDLREGLASNASRAGEEIARLASNLDDLMNAFDNPAAIEKFAKALKDSLVTPQQEFDKFLEKVQALQAFEFITPAEAATAIATAARDLDDATEGIARKREQKEQDDKRAGLAAQRAVETPIETAMRRVKEIERLFSVGALGERGDEVRRRAIQKEADDLRIEEEKDKFGPRNAGAVEQGTQAAFGAIMASINQRGNSTERDIAKTNKQIAKATRETANTIESIANTDPEFTELKAP